MPLNFKRVRMGIAVAALLTVPAVALADNALIDGDGVVPYADNDMAFGSVGCAVATEKTAGVLITRQGSAASTNTFKNDAVVTISVQSVAGSGLSASVPAASKTITLPSNWTNLSNGTLSTAVASKVTVNSSTPGSGSGSVTYRATGSNTSGTEITRDDTMNVTWTTGSCAPPDSTPPSITPNIQGTLGSNGWYTSDVSVSWTVDESESTVSSQSGCGRTTISTDTTDTTLTCSATSAGGPASNSVTIKRDATAPSNVATALDRTADHNGWYNGSVGWVTTGTDATSGIPVGGCDTGTYSAPDGSGRTVTGDCTDNAGNSASATSAAFNYDATKPTLNPAVTPNPVLLNAAASAAPGARDATSDIASASCAAVDTSAVGIQSVSCQATDNAGNQNSASASYKVEYKFNGFFQPVDNKMLNGMKAGSTAPIRWQLLDANGVAVSSLAAVTKATSGVMACDASAPVDNLEEYATGSTQLRYDATASQFIYNWQSPKAPGKCYKVVLTFADGTTQSVSFALK